MKKEYIDFYLAVTDIKRLKPDVWHRCPASAEKKEFLQWYERTTMAIRFSQGETHFMIDVYPTEAEKKRVLSMVGYEPQTKKVNQHIFSKKQISTGVTQKFVKREIPGTERPPSEISLRILRAEAEKKNASAKEHLARLEQRRKFAEFVKAEQEDDDGL